MPPASPLARMEGLIASQRAAPKRRLVLHSGDLLIGPALARGKPTMGDYALGMVRREPSKFDDMVELCFLWRDPFDGRPVEVRGAVRIDKSVMVSNRFTVLAEAEVPPPYTAADVALLGGAKNSHAFAAVGFQVHKPHDSCYLR